MAPGSAPPYRQAVACPSSWISRAVVRMRVHHQRQGRVQEQLEERACEVARGRRRRARRQPPWPRPRARPPGASTPGAASRASRRVQVGGIRMPLTVRARSGLARGGRDVASSPPTCSTSPSGASRCSIRYSSPAGVSVRPSAALTRPAISSGDRDGSTWMRTRCSSSVSWSIWSSQRRTR